MGGCLSQHNIDSEMAVAHDLEGNSALDRNDMSPSNIDQLTAQGGSAEYIGVYIEDEVMLPVSDNQTEEPLTAVPLDISHNFQNVDERFVMATNGITEQNDVDQPLYHEQPVQSVSMDDRETVPSQPPANVAKDNVQNAVQGVRTQQDGDSDVGVVFEGRTYRKRVFDENLKNYVYVTDDVYVADGNLQPNGPLVI